MTDSFQRLIRLESRAILAVRFGVEMLAGR